MTDRDAPRGVWPTSLAEYLGWQALAVRDGVHRASMQVRPEHLAPNGYLQAGVVVALADIAARAEALRRCRLAAASPRSS